MAPSPDPLPSLLDSQVTIILSTFEKEEQASDAIRTLLQERLIACGTILHRVRSIYVWKGSVQDSDEVQVILKTQTNCAKEASRRLAEVHPYEVPEILALPAASAASYAEWIGQSVSPSGTVSPDPAE